MLIFRRFSESNRGSLNLYIYARAPAPGWVVFLYTDCKIKVPENTMCSLIFHSKISPKNPPKHPPYHQKTPSNSKTYALLIPTILFRLFFSSLFPPFLHFSTHFSTFPHPIAIPQPNPTPLFVTYHVTF